MPKAYVSSTFEDLREHRAMAQLVLKRFGYEDVAMEYYVAGDERPLDRCLADVRACDLYIGIFAWRYGFVPDGEKFSITELEYRQAVKAKKPRVLFVIDEDAAWPPKLMDRDRTRIEAFHERVRKDRMVSKFSTPDTLEGRLSAALEQRGAKLLQAPGIDMEAYARFLRRQYNVLDLDALTDPKRDELLALRVQAVFVEQNVKEDPPPLELPKETWERLVSREEVHADDLPKGITAEMLADLRSAYGNKPARPVVEVLASPDNRCSIVLGDPGSGKSTLLRYLALSLIDGSSNARLQPALAGRVPFLVDLKSYTALRAQNRCDTFYGYFDVLAKQEGCPVTGDRLRAHLDEGLPAVVMFDGVDEIFQPAEQEAITKQIIAFADTYPEARIIVTSRIIGYRRALLTKAGFRHFTLQDLDEPQVKEFVRHWYTLTLTGSAAEAEARIERIQQSFTASPSIRQLAGNPMLLTIMAIIGKHQELPRERWKLYDHAASVLVQHWDVKKHLAGNDLMDEEDKKELLRRLAYAMQAGEGGLAGNYIHADELQAEFERYLRERYAFDPLRARNTAREIIHQLRERNFILSFYGANLYGFVHRAFLEFFCADAIRVRFEKTKELPLSGLNEIFDTRWKEKEWHEVLRLICGMIGEEFAGEMIDDLQSIDWRTTDGSNIVLAVQCLQEIRRPEVLPDAGRKLLLTLLDFAWFSPMLLTKMHALTAAGDIGGRWPGREVLIEWLSQLPAEPPSELDLDTLGRMVGSLGRGSPAVRRAILRRLRNRHDQYAELTVTALAKGWPDRRTVSLLMDPDRLHDATFKSVSFSAAAQFLRPFPVVADRLFSDPNPEVWAVMIYFADDFRALPTLLREAKRDGAWQRVAVLKLQYYVHVAAAQILLRRLAKTAKDGWVRNTASLILTGANLDVPKRPRRKKPTAPA
jgi:energy-coupling factor transporter ATP-binding protein EcfA2